MLDSGHPRTQCVATKTPVFQRNKNGISEILGSTNTHKKVHALALSNKWHLNERLGEKELYYA